MDRIQILRHLCEGRSPKAIASDGAADVGEVLALKADAGRASLWYQDKVLRKLETQHIHLSARRTFDFPKSGLWTWLALDAEIKLVVSWALGGRDGNIAALFLDEVLARSSVPSKVTAEDDAGEIVELAAASSADYGLLNRAFGFATRSGMTESKNRILHRGFLELSEAQREAVEEHAYGLALSALHWNFVCERDGRTPAMAAGITDWPWSIKHLADIIEMWTNLKTGPWYERVVLLGENSEGE